MKIRRYEDVRLLFEETEDEAVQLALVNLRRDLMRTLDCHVNRKANTSAKTIVVGTIGVNSVLETRLELACLKDTSGAYRKEAFLIREKDGVLYIAGTDRRGTIYGIYDFCEWLGVSPWYFFADVPVKKRQEAVIEPDYQKVEYPSVEYRGIFINDEEELEHWVWNYMGEETIGVKTYDKIFELLLRLKLNYIWPAMHVNSFNVKQENGALANRMGIVVGTSHCDMLMRSNNREWYPWIAKKGYDGIKYDYSIPGRNREVLEEYWRESVEQNQSFEVSYTLGMRGIHDSGFETETLAGLTGEALRNAKIELLESVITAQQKILHDVLDGTDRENTMKIFVPYKEVLELYDNGLEVPEDLTLIWTNDNYGYVRRYPGEKEKQRIGGNGLYYHNSYWAPPGGSYLFVNTIPLSHTRNELKKAWNEGIQKLWVTNFGAIKPLEQQLTFYARLAWEVGKENAVTDHEQQFLQEWIDKTFSGNLGAKLAPMLTAFDQVVNARKLEQMDCDAFSQTAYGDEAADRLHVLKQIFDETNALYETLPKQEKDAFYQLVLMRIQAAYLTNGMYYYADRSNLCMAQGKHRSAQVYTERSLAYDHARRKMLHYYNRVMCNGKWDGILTPEDFPPPRTAMHPACMPPLSIGPRQMLVTVWNEKESLSFVNHGTKWIEIANAGIGSFTYSITLPEWLEADCVSGTVEDEVRILLQPGKLAVGSCSGVITVTNETDGQVREIAVTFCSVSETSEQTAVEDDGRIVIEAADARIPAGGWKQIPNLGRHHGPLLEAEESGKTAEFSFYLTTAGSPLLELHRFPTLNSIGQIRVGVQLDGGAQRVASTASNDEHRGTWRENVRNNVDKVYEQLPYLEAGLHTLTLTAIDRYFSISRMVLYTEERKENSLGCLTEKQQLPAQIDILAFADSFYGKEEPEPRPVHYLPANPAGDCLTHEDIMVGPMPFRHCEFADKNHRMEDVLVGSKQIHRITPQDILAQAQAAATETEGVIRIESAAVLAETDYAWTENGPWQYCSSPAYQDTGLAMYLRQAGLSWKDPAEAPSLHYQLQTSGGRYRIWIKMHMWGTDTAHFTLGMDGEVLPERALYGGQDIWRYSNEQIWKWIPAYEWELTAGMHELAIYALSSHLRIGEIYLTKGEELPTEQ